MDTAVLIFERRWSSATQNVNQARMAIRPLLAEYRFVDTDMVELAIGEACANAVEHGSPKAKGNYFTLRCRVAKSTSTLIFEVEDEGTGVAAAKIPLGQMPDMLADGGRGLYLIKEIMDDVTLKSTPRGLNIRMTKRFHR